MTALTCLLAAAAITVQVEPNAKGHDVPDSLWGIFFEDINWAADGGLNPELLANAGFDWKQADHEKWNRKDDGWEGDFREDGMARLSFQMGAPVHPNTAKHLRIESFGKGLAGVRNTGLDGFTLKKGEPYRLVFDWREVAVKGIDYELGAWQRVTQDFVYDFDTKDLVSNPSFRVEVAGDHLSLLVSGRRAVEFDNVSLQPTGPNLVRGGLRKDLVDKLADLHPAFVRFPGGCIVEEGDFQHWYDWRRTVGPKERRECIWNRWGNSSAPYWETFGVGYYEYFRLCEEIGAEPLPISLAGLTCQFQKPVQFAAVEDVDYFAQVMLDLIEFANGDETTTWGKVRAEMGHPKPFNMKMMGIGNENWDAEFWERVVPICKIVRAKHPEIKIVGSVGPSPAGKSFEYGWMRATKELNDFMDEHYYQSPEWFLSNTGRYDGYDRVNKPLVYAGEYACHHPVDGKKPNSLWSALCEAAMMTGFERNSDVVRMASYAPLFAREGHVQWTPNLIWFDGEKSYGTPNYYVQQLFACNRPTQHVPSVAVAADKPATIAGHVGLQTWNTAAEFKDIVVKDAAGQVVFSGLPDLAASQIAAEGKWSVREGVLVQSALRATDTALTLPCPATDAATVSFKARRTAGEEGFIFRFFDTDGARVFVNIGGWYNKEHGIELKGDKPFSAPLPARVPGRLETNRWYAFEATFAKGRLVSAALDGKILFSNVAFNAASDFYSVVGFDAAKNEYVVKCVNVAETARPCTVAFGKAQPAGKVTALTLAGDKLGVNTISEPAKYATKTTSVDFAGGDAFTAELPPLSVTVFRVPGVR